MENKEISDKLKEILQLRYEPVAVKLVKKGEDIPAEFNQPEKKTRHCQSIMKAMKGECLVIPADKHACVVGGSSLGLLETPDNVKSGEFHSKIGMFDTPQAAAKMIEERAEFEDCSMLATVVCPLAKADFKPDVVILIDLPETLYWIVPAFTFEKGGRVTMSTAPFQATCVDSTIIPIQTGDINYSMGCFGCRRTTDIGRDEMLVGIPGPILENIVEHLEKLYEKPIKKARGL